MDTNPSHRGLDALGQSPYPRFRLRAAVLKNFNELKQARGMLWPWAEIAQAMGLPARQGRELGVVYRRIEKQIAAGKLKLPQQQPTRRRSLENADRSNSSNKSGFINLDKVTK